MSGIKIIRVTAADKKKLLQVQHLFDELYSYIKKTEKNLMLPPEKNASEIWGESVQKILGRFGELIVAVENATVIGFAAGVLRLTPDYLGGKKVGYITFFFVSPSARKKNIGKKMLVKLENQFRDKKVHSIELQITYNNTDGQAFWKAMGYKNELVQLRKICA